LYLLFLGFRRLRAVLLSVLLPLRALLLCLGPVLGPVLLALGALLL
jgi:hypothetical protein